PLKLALSLRNPHSAFFAPHIIGLPDFQADGEVAAGFRDENFLVRVRNLCARDQIDSFGDAFVHENAVADLHRRLGLAPGFSSVVAPAHKRKLTSAIPARKPAGAAYRILSSFCTSASREKSRSCESGTRLSDLSSFKRASTAN